MANEPKISPSRVSSPEHEALLARELNYIPEGPSASDQNTFRQEYEHFRREALAVDGKSESRTAIAEATRSVRRYAVDFVPEYDPLLLGARDKQPSREPASDAGSA